MIVVKKQGFCSSSKAIGLLGTFLLLVVVVSRPCYSSSTFSSEHIRFIFVASKQHQHQHQHQRQHQNIDKKMLLLAKKNPPWMKVPRGGSESFEQDFPSSIVKDDDVVGGGALMVVSALKGLISYMKGPKADTLLLLFTTALNAPLCRTIKTSPILGYLVLGLFFGPNGYSLIRDIHTTEMMADIGIIFFLFEMGLHLDFQTLMSMRRDVFGLGASQFIATAAIVAVICNMCFGLSMAAQIVIGGGLALSSSAFVLQLLKDKDQMNTTFGKSSFGVLLLQDLAVVPLIIVTPILAGGKGGLADALGSASIKAAIALTTIAVIGKFLLKPFFNAVANTKSQEAFVGAILSAVLGMSFLTEGLGLSNTLGAFLAGVLLSETEHRHHIETEIAPFRGILVGLFFFTVGFEIDLQLIGSKPGLVTALVLGISSLKAAIAFVVSLLFGLKKGTALRVGLILSQGGEFAFVAFRLARSCGILSDEITKLMLTCVSLTMGLTPFLDDFGAKKADALNTRQDSDERKHKVVHKKRV